VVETNIHHPTDSRILGDGVRVVSRLLRRAKPVLGEQVELGKAAFRTRTRSVRRVAQQLHRVARRKGEQAAEELRQSYAKLLAIVRASRAQAAQVRAALQARGGALAQGLVERFDGVLPLVAQAIDQATRRVMQGAPVPSEEKLLSLFEPHTQVIRRHKAGQPTEFGRKLLLDEVEGGIISRYELLDDVGLEHPHLPRSLEAHRQRFARAPDVLAGDRGLYSPENEALARQAGVKHVVLPKTGRLSRERQQHERQRWFKRGFRFRAGIEGRIHVLQRDYGLARCRDHGAVGMGRWVGWGVVVHNLAQIARSQAWRQARANRRAA